MSVISLGFESALDVHNVTITPDVVGASMSFKLDGRDVRIELPSDTGEKGYFTPQGVHPERGPSEYELHRLYVRFELGETRDLPDEILERPRNQYDLVSDQDEQWLSRRASELDGVGRSIYELWLRVLRWKTLDGSLGRIPQHPLTGFATLTDWPSRTRIWGRGGSFVLHLTQPHLTTAVWGEVEQALRVGGAPIHFDLLFNAEQQFELGDLDLCVVLLAVACEVFMKEWTLKAIPVGMLPKSAARLLERAPVREGKFKMFAETLLAHEADQFDAVRDDLDALFLARNNVAHRGSDRALKDADCLKYAHAARRLLLLGSDVTRKFRPLTARIHEYRHLPRVLRNGG